MSEERARSEATPLGGVDAHDEVEDATVIVERTAERLAGASLEPEPDWDPADADTADRPEEATVVVDRTGGGEVDETRVVDRGASAERAEAAERAEPGTAAEAVVTPAEPVLKTPDRRRRRREPAPAPVSDEVLRTAEQGPGVGVLDRYPARTGEPLRMPIPELGEGPGPTRDAAAPLPSVARRSRRSAVGALVAVVVAGALGLAGLIAVGSILWRSLFG
ncbi:hypothetical protein [Agromyces soli]|uniref:Uncharacterized protein n=1 Tax=Agromyces soli TaxID=659012 RepID=A0ABY4AYJ5_9MICO|nr:hypothetical protein [Agromyces soli]UOE26913.1 hypothetical protein MTP13_03765 [Agromyces soli]